MVDALDRAIRHLRPGGLLIDARPDGSRPPRVIARGRAVGDVLPREDIALDDAAADRAIATMVQRGRLRSLERGDLWHQMSFRSLNELDEYLRNSPRYAKLSPGTRERVPKDGSGRLAMRRAIKYELLARIGPR